MDQIFPTIALLARKKQELRRRVRKSHVHLVEVFSIDTVSREPFTLLLWIRGHSGLESFKSFILYEFLRGRKRMRLRE